MSDRFFRLFKAVKLKLSEEEARNKVLAEVSSNTSEKDKEWEKALFSDLVEKLVIIEEKLEQTHDLTDKYQDFLKDNDVTLTSKDSIGKHIGKIIRLTKSIEEKARKWDITHRY